MKSMKMETRHMAEYYKVKDIACRDTVIWSNGRFFKIYLYHVVGRDLVLVKRSMKIFALSQVFPRMTLCTRRNLAIANRSRVSSAAYTIRRGHK